MNKTVQWLIRNKDGRVDGPFTTQEVLRKIHTGMYMGEEFISRFPAGRWHPISRREEFFDALLETLEGEMGLGGEDDGPPPAFEEDTPLDVPHEVHVEENPTPKVGKAVAETFGGKTAIVIEEELEDPKRKKKKGRAVVDEAVRSSKKKTSSSQGSKVEPKLKKRSKRSNRAKLQWAIFAAVCLILYLVIFKSPTGRTGENLFHLRRPTAYRGEPMTKQQVSRTMGRAIVHFRKDTLEDYIKAQDALIEVIEKSNYLKAYSLLCMTYRELWPYTYQDGDDYRAVEIVLGRAQKLNPKGEDSATCLVVNQWVNGRYDDALRIMDTYLNERPELIFFNQMTGDIYASRKEYDHAANYFARVRELWQPPPVWSKTLLQEARMYRKRQSFGNAIKLYRRLLKDNPGHAVALIELGLIEFDPNQEIEKAQGHIRSGLISDQSIPKSIESEAYVALAKMDVLKGDRRQALKHAQKAFSADSSNQEARELVVGLGGLKALNAVTIDNVNMVYIGEQYMKMGNYAAAQAEFRAAFEANKDNAFAALRAGQALWRLNQSNDAIAWVKKSVIADPNFVNSYIILADYMSARYDYVNAIATLKQALKVNRHHHGIYRGFALVELRRRNFDGAIRFAKKALDLYDTDIESILIMAKAYLGIGDYEEAFQFSQRALELDSSNEDAQVTYARVLIGLQGTQAGIDRLKALIASFDKVVYIRALGEVLMDEERFSEAIQAFNEALSKDPKNKPTLMAFAKLMQRQKEYSGARDFFLEAAAIDPSDAEPLFLTGKLYLESDQQAFALQQFNRVIDVNPKYPLAHYYTGRAMLGMGQKEKALAMAIEERKINPDIPESYSLAADAYYEMGQYSMCVKENQNAINKGRTTADAYIALARCQRLSGALDAAETMLDQASKLESGNPNIYKELGALYHAQGSRDKAVEAYERYLLLNPQAKDRLSIKNAIRTLESGGK
ncbi:MAG: tetratricopeptide repeat protein [Bdellovibrionales bacterium]|nr:tetratricopeptide repeat protein [Bdellovibrionales bacterium]